MNVIQKLTLRHMRMSKKRTLVTIIGVIISVAMITAVATAGSSAIDLLRRRDMKDTGRWHVEYENVYGDKLNKVKESPNTKSYMLSKKLGYSPLEGEENVFKPYLYVESYNKENMSNRSIRIMKGRLPQNSNEIIVPEHLQYDGGIEYKIGDKISVSLGKRYQIDNGTKYYMDQDNAYVSEQQVEEGLQEEYYESGETREYTVVGIMERARWENYSAPGYTAITCFSEKELSSDDTVNVFVELNKVTNKMYKNDNWGLNSSEIQKPDEFGNYNIILNYSLLRSYGVTGDDSFNNMINVLVIVLLFIILIGSVSLIYNAFAISISERSKYLGMLASVGATKKQKRSSVFFEGFIIGVISIPIGILAGTLGLGITFKIINPMVKNVLSIDFGLNLVISEESILLAVIFSIITIFVSTYIPARRASKITPIEAIRQNKDIKIKSKAVKTSKFTRKLFGFEGELALKNLKRNRKRYRATVISLIISMVLFLSVASYCYYLKNAYSMTQKNYNYDIKMTGNSDDIYTKIFKEAQEKESVKESVIAYQSSFDYVIDINNKKGEEFLTEEFKNNYYEYTGTSAEAEESFRVHVKIKALDDGSLKEYIDRTETDIDLESLYDIENPKAILMNTFKVKFQMGIREFEVLNVSEGDKADILLREYDEIGGHKEKKAASLIIADTTNVLPIGDNYGEYMSDNLILYVSKDVLDSIVDNNYYAEASFKSDKPKRMSKELEELLEGYSEYGVYSYNIYKSNLEEKQMMTLIEVFAYGFIVLISAICAANIFNTISTSVELRKREFAMLKSVGMTPKSFHKMIVFESMFYGIKSLMWGLPLGIIAMIFVSREVGNVYRSNTDYPLGRIIFAVLSVFIVVGLSMMYSSGKVKRDNVIDVLKDEI